MSLLDRLFGRRSHSSSEVPFASGDGDCDIEAVGESNYQDALWRAVRNAAVTERGYRVETVATLRAEPSNPYDRNAVQVLIDGRLVGYLSREDAIVFAPLMQRFTGQVRCPGLICGGFATDAGRAHLGVWLDPPEPERHARAAAEPVRVTGRSSAAMSDAQEHGLFEGKHYTEYVDDVKALKRHKAYEEALALLTGLLGAVERESAATQWGVAPWYYEQAAIVYRKQRDFDGEIAVLERFAAQQQAPGDGPAELILRLEKARARRDKTGTA